MGYLNLTYEEYQSNIDFWLGTKGIKLPNWADEIAAYGTGVGAIDFYDDIFGDTLEEHKERGEYVTGEYGGIALEVKYVVTSEGKKSVAHRTTVTKGNQELYDLIEGSENFCMIAPVSYAGRTRSNENARFLYALCIEIDDIEPRAGIKELFYSFRRENARMPLPTYIVCSGTGLHLYIVFEKPIPLFSNIFQKLTEIKQCITSWWWNKYISNSYEKIQYESVCQAFRCVGTRGKDPHKIAMAFKTGEKWTIEGLNELMPDTLQLTTLYKRKMSLEQAKELYPDWYKRRIIEGKGRQCYSRYEGIYYNWQEKMKSKDNGAAVGKRYNCLENLCSLAVQCNISPEQVEKDCRAMAEYLETLTNDEGNHFTEYDIMCALSTYYRGGEGAYRRRREYIANKTGIELSENKRNHRKRDVHVKYMNNQRAFKVEMGECTNGGRPIGSGTAQSQVIDWQWANPKGTKAQCNRETGLDPKTIRKWWKELDMEQKKPQVDYAVFDNEGNMLGIIETEHMDKETASKNFNKRVKAYYEELRKLEKAQDNSDKNDK